MFEVVAVCSLEPSFSRQIADEYGIPYTCDEPEGIYEMKNIDVIDICTPPYLHAEQMRKSLLAGKNVICEKPLVGSLKEVDELGDLASKNGKHILPIFQYRFGHGFQKLKRLIESGVTGRPYLTTVEVAWRRRADYYAIPWRGRWATELGGTLLSHGIHALDLLCEALGPAQRVFAQAATRVNPIEVEDCLVASLRMSDGSLASLSTTVGSTVEITRHRFCFANLVAESNTRPYTSSGEPWSFVGDSLEIDQQIQETLAGFQPNREGFEGQFEQYYQALERDGALPVTLEEARRALEIVFAAYYSARRGEEVRLPIPPDAPEYIGFSSNGG
jgi:predicted dehydrogenase